MYYDAPAAGTTTTFAVHVPITAKTALCLASHYKSRQACVLVTPKGTGAPVVTTIPVSTLDPYPLVDDKLRFPFPKCGTCW
jgi:hypothetical protein